MRILDLKKSVFGGVNRQEFPALFVSMAISETLSVKKSSSKTDHSSETLTKRRCRVKATHGCRSLSVLIRCIAAFSPIIIICVTLLEVRVWCT